MIKEHELNVELSREVFNKCKDYIESKGCYNNVFNVIQYYSRNFGKDGDWKIAYGFMKSVRNIMVRHAFIIDKDGRVVDPTIIRSPYFKDDDSIFYITFKIFEYDEYINALINNDNQPDFYNVFTEEESQAREWGFKRGLICTG